MTLHWLRIECLAAVALSLTAPAFAQNRYGLLLEDEPVTARFSRRADLQSAAAAAYRRRVESAQSGVRAELANRNIAITGAVTTLANAVFVTASPDRLAELKSLPGVRGVIPMRRHEALLSRATTLMGALDAWNATPGGVANAGAGIKIAIFDTGVDQANAVFQDPSLPMPAGFPKGDIAFTTNKVIVARSYIKQLGAGSSAANPAADSRPDDFSPRDHVGHGTATASAAAGFSATGTVTIRGMAPKAYIGNYKIIGSPQINDGTYDDIMILALNDAMSDGMDIVSMSIAGSALTGPLDTGATCGQPAKVPCDLAAYTFEQAAKSGMVILVAAGNSGPGYGSISSPSSAPSVMAVGATTNSHSFSPLVQVSGAAVPNTINSISALRSTASSTVGGTVTAPLVDITTLGDDGRACSPLPAYSLNGSIALILRGPCTFSVKMTNAVNAGAAGVIFYNTTTQQFTGPGGLGSFIQSAVMVANADGVNLKTFLATHPGYPASINPYAVEISGQVPNNLASFSSRGPALGTNGIKPDLLATGSSLYMAAQKYDPLGEMFSADGFIFAAGTSFSTPLAAGAAALVKQNHPGYSAAQIRSALIDTVTQDVTLDDGGNAVNFLQTGPGRMTVDQAIKSNLTATPATLSFGAIAAVPATLTFELTNTGSTTAALTLSNSSANNPVTVAPTSVSLAAGASTTVTVSVTGGLPTAGFYSGAVTVAGGAVPFRVPYMCLAGSGKAVNFQALSGDFNDGTVNQPIPDGVIAFQLTDSFGVAVAAQPVSFFIPDNGVTLSKVSTATDAYGMAYASVTMGPVARGSNNPYLISACAALACTANFAQTNSLGYQFTEYSRAAPAITPAGVVNAASYQQPVAPGSYIAIFGTGMYDAELSATGNPLEVNSQQRLPLVIDFTTVSFDVPSAKLSVPGRLYYISAGQLGLQVPWELAGQTSAQVKVSIDFTSGNVVTIPLSNYAPALFPVGAFAAATNDKGVITAANPAARSSLITLYANGMGPVDNTPVSGEPTPLSPLARTTTTPVVTIGGQFAQVLFSGLAPGSIGLYQINVQVPAGLAAGTQTLGVSIGGASARTTSLPVI